MVGAKPATRRPAVNAASPASSGATGPWRSAILPPTTVAKSMPIVKREKIQA